MEEVTFVRPSFDTVMMLIFFAGLMAAVIGLCLMTIKRNRAERERNFLLKAGALKGGMITLDELESLDEKFLSGNTEVLASYYRHHYLAMGEKDYWPARIIGLVKEIEEYDRNSDHPGKYALIALKKAVISLKPEELAEIIILSIANEANGLQSLRHSETRDYLRHIFWNEEADAESSALRSAADDLAPSLLSRLQRRLSEILNDPMKDNVEKMLFESAIATFNHALQKGKTKG